MDASKSVTATFVLTVSGTKTVSGSLTEGGAVSYSIVLSNTGPFAQDDNPGPEFTDILPSGLTLSSALATSGTATVGGNMVSWNGSIPVSASVTITIDATINPGTAGQLVSNQGTLSLDHDGDGANETSVRTDDPRVVGTGDATVFRVTTGAYYTVTPCRVVDTRDPGGPLGSPALLALADRTFTVAGVCGIPADATAISVNLAVTGPTDAGNVRLRAGGSVVPLVSSINYAAGQTR